MLSGGDPGISESLVELTNPVPGTTTTVRKSAGYLMSRIHVALLRHGFKFRTNVSSGKLQAFS